MTLKRDTQALDSSKPKGSSTVTIPTGRHEIERIPNPYHHTNAPWLILKGTSIGATEGSWRQWADPKYGDWQVVIEE